MNIKKNKVGWRVEDYKEYCFELEGELARRQLRGKRQRKNLRDMNRKLERLGLIRTVNELVAKDKPAQDVRVVHGGWNRAGRVTAQYGVQMPRV